MQSLKDTDFMSHIFRNNVLTQILPNTLFGFTETYTRDAFAIVIKFIYDSTKQAIERTQSYYIIRLSDKFYKKIIDALCFLFYISLLNYAWT